MYSLSTFWDYRESLGLANIQMGGKAEVTISFFDTRNRTVRKRKLYLNKSTWFTKIKKNAQMFPQGVYNFGEVNRIYIKLSAQGQKEQVQ